ncbi:unnamed protein product [marine sediment metagenome]|uniref:Methyltransferase type 11 domain-containing protein n=1 Tax=marine sediment metagenome TaxID=412755 RepID=X0SZM2_9ZZZZ
MVNRAGLNTLDAICSKRHGHIGPTERHTWRWVKRLLPKYCCHGAVIDIGCGNGRYLGRLYEMGFSEIWGIDASKEAIQLAKRVMSNLPVILQHVVLPEQGELPDRYFRGAICLEVLEHIQDDLKTLQTIHRLLIPGGVLLLSVPAGINYWTEHDIRGGHVRRYNVNEMRNKLLSAGFVNVRVFTWGFPLQSAYYKFYLTKRRVSTGQQVMSPRLTHTILTEVFYQALYMDDLFTWTGRGTQLIACARA